VLSSPLDERVAYQPGLVASYGEQLRREMEDAAALCSQAVRDVLPQRLLASVDIDGMDAEARQLLNETVRGAEELAREVALTRTVPQCSLRESCVSRVVSCRVVSCRVVSCRVVSCRVVSCRVVSCRLCGAGRRVVQGTEQELREYLQQAKHRLFRHIVQRVSPHLRSQFPEAGAALDKLGRIHDSMFLGRGDAQSIDTMPSLRVRRQPSTARQSAQPGGMLAVRVVPDGAMSPPIAPPQSRAVDVFAALRPSNLYGLLMTYVGVASLCRCVECVISCVVS
jgi:hypothetical protein